MSSVHCRLPLLFFQTVAAPRAAIDADAARLTLPVEELADRFLRGLKLAHKRFYCERLLFMLSLCPLGGQVQGLAATFNVTNDTAATALQSTCRILLLSDSPQVKF
jgi:hypothetical protein